MRGASQVGTMIFAEIERDQEKPDLLFFIPS